MNIGEAEILFNIDGLKFICVCVGGRGESTGIES